MTCPACRADVAIWLARGGQVYGPYTLADLKQAEAAGRLGREDMVKVGEQRQWQPLSEFLGAAAAPALAPPPVSPAPPPAAPVYPSERPARPKSDNTVAVVLVVVGVFMLVVIGGMAAILIPVFVRARERAVQTSCLSNIKQVSMGLLMYCQDYDERFPRLPAVVERSTSQQGVIATGAPAPLAGYWPDDNWRSCLMPYIKNTQVFLCPGTQSVYSYQLNDSLYNVEMRELTRPAELVGIYESGFLTGSPPGPHNQGWNVGFTDGHCKWMSQRGTVLTKP